MATASAARAAKASAKAKEQQAEVSLPNRREFLYYIWGASMVLLMGEATVGLLWFAVPRFKEGEFGGVFTFNPAEVPEVDADPVPVPTGRFWVSHPEQGLVVLYNVCTHLGCLPKWVATNHRFECPCHGSKYEIDGKYIEGPAPRSLDRFFTTVTFDDGTTVTSNEIGDPIPIEGRTIVSIRIDTGNRIKRPGRV